MEITILGVGFKSDHRHFRCRYCLTKKSIRDESFLEHVHQGLQEFARCVFYYFCKGYDSELAFRELTENCPNECGASIAHSTVYSLYAAARDRISKYNIEAIKVKKFGGPGSEVMVDIYKLNLKSVNRWRAEEYYLLGFIEKATGRARAYVMPNSKTQTVVQYLAKTVARGSVLYTPFYCQGGWDFLDKYFEHKRLVTPKGQKYDYEEERARFCKLSGFDKMWACVRTIETCWLKYQKNMRKYGNVHENLQIYVDEQVFRAQNNTLAKKREALCAAFDCD
jgi:hypothetical protein